ncbi:hypothetical protein [Mycoplasma sp. 4079]|uniref:hypothetical protein n=1 Tax=Mycoplasma sp. 4079 TaxID=3398615 RepID=UPI0039FC28E1
MRKFFSKKAIPFLLGAATIATMPLATVSCLYEDNKTVLYAKNYENNNVFIKRKQDRNTDEEVIKKINEWKVWKPSLVELLNKFDDNNVMTYTFTYWDFLFKNRFEVNNDNLKIHVDKFYVINPDSKSISVNEDLFKNKLAHVAENVKEKFRSLVISTNEAIVEYFKKPSTKGVDSISAIEALVAMTDDLLKKQEYTSEHISLKSKISSIINKNVFIEDAKRYISPEDVKEALTIYFKNTPFMDVIIEDDTKSADEKIVKFDSENRSFIIDFSMNNKINSGITSDLFESIFKEVQGSLNNYDYSKSEKDVKTVFAKVLYRLIEDSRSFTIQRDLQNNIMTKSPSGIGNGFSPAYFIDGFNPDTGKLSDTFKIFKQESIDHAKELSPLNKTKYNKTSLSDREAYDFKADPVRFFETHKHLVWFGTEPNSAYGFFTSTKSPYYSSKDILLSNDDNFTDEDKNAAKKHIELCEQRYEEVMDLVNQLKELETQNFAWQAQIDEATTDPEKAVFLAKIEENNKKIDAIMTTQIALPTSASDLEQVQVTTLKEGYDQSSKKLAIGKAKVGTNVQSFVEFFSKVAFTLGVSNTQVVCGNTPELQNTYWLEFKDASGQWYLLDVFKIYTEFYYTENEYVDKVQENGTTTKELVNGTGSRKDISSLSVEYIKSQIQTSLPSGYTVSAEYLPYANIK